MLGKTRILPKILYFTFIFARYELAEKRECKILGMELLPHEQFGFPNKADQRN